MRDDQLIIEDLNLNETLSKWLSHVSRDEEVYFSLSNEDWPVTRSWLISPESLPRYPKFISRVEELQQNLNTHRVEILTYFQQFHYADPSYWEDLMEKPQAKQLEAVLNCAALATINDHLHTSDELHELQIIQNYLSCYALDNPEKFQPLISIAAQLSFQINASRGLSNFLGELTSATMPTEEGGTNILPSTLEIIQRRHNLLESTEESSSWRTWLRDATDQFSENIKELFTASIPIPQAISFSGAGKAPMSSLVWEGKGCVLSMVNIDGKVLVKWSGNRKLEAVLIDQSPLKCTDEQDFSQNVVQFWGPVKPPVNQITFFDGREAYRINFQK
jgi:hypothetical protein